MSILGSIKEIFQKRNKIDIEKLNKGNKKEEEKLLRLIYKTKKEATLKKLARKEAVRLAKIHARREAKQLIKEKFGKRKSSFFDLGSLDFVGIEPVGFSKTKKRKRKKMSYWDLPSAI